MGSVGVASEPGGEQAARSRGRAKSWRFGILNQQNDKRICFQECAALSFYPNWFVCMYV